MSRATEQQATQHAGATTAGQGPDLDAEHDPDVARRASRAALKRVADKSDQTPSSATEGARKVERDKTNQSSLDGLQSAVTASAKQMLVLATSIETVIAASPDEAGWDRQAQAIKAHVESVTDSISVLEVSVAFAKAANVPVEQLQHALAIFDRAYNRLF